STLAPLITGTEPIHGVIDTLRGTSTGEEASRALAEARDRIAAIDHGGLGAPAARYLEVAETLSPLPAKVDLARLFQVDLFKPAGRTTLGGAALAGLTSALETLRRIARPTLQVDLERFREQFVARYETRPVRLVEALDDERGIGFGGAASD